MIGIKVRTLRYLYQIRNDNLFGKDVIVSILTTDEKQCCWCGSTNTVPNVDMEKWRICMDCGGYFKPTPEGHRR